MGNSPIIKKGFIFKIVTGLIRFLLLLLCRIDPSAFDLVPDQGPLILVCNHVNFLEVPAVYTFLQPRLITGFSKSESWDNPLKRALFNLWGAIPLHRGEADLKALRKGIAFLKAGGLVAIAPEGTRSYNGKLQQAHAGVVLFALHSGAPLLPLVYYGGEKFWDQLYRFRKTSFNVQTGKIFYLDPGDQQVTASVRQQMLNEIMYQLAELLPPEYQGYYADLENATTNYLRFVENNS